MRDITYKNYILKSAYLNQSTKELYISKLNIIQNEIWKNCKGVNNVNVKGRCLDYIIKHPELFMERLDEYISKTKGRIYDNLSIHAKNSYITAILAVFRQTPTMLQKYPDIFKKWETIQREMRQPINDKYMENRPDDRQMEAFITFKELIKARDKLKIGTMARLLLAMYSMIPPVRSDYDSIKIYQKRNEEEIDSDNYLIM